MKEHHLVIKDDLRKKIEQAAIRHASKTKKLLTWQEYARVVLKEKVTGASRP